MPSPDGAALAYLYNQVGTDDFALRDLASGALGARHPTQHPYAGWQDWTPDGRHLITVGDDAHARVWDTTTGELVADRVLPFGSPSGSIGWRAGGDTIFLGQHAGSVLELDADTFERVRDLLSFDGRVSNVDVSPDGSLLAVAMAKFSDGRRVSVALVDYATREIVATFDDVDASWQLDFSPDGSVLAAGGTDGLVTLIDPVGRRTVGAPLQGVDGPVIALSFSPDSTTMVTSSTDGTVELWDVPGRARVARVTPGEPGHRVFTWFDDDGTTVFAADDGGGIWSFPSDPDEWQQRACEIAGRNLTHAEWDDLFPSRPYRATCQDQPAGG
jgi:WD40 repeat protein